LKKIQNTDVLSLCFLCSTIILSISAAITHSNDLSSIRYLLHLSMLRGGDKVSSEVDSVASSQNPKSPNKKCISAERKEIIESNGNKNKQRNIITGEELEGGLKVFDLTNSKSKAKNNENVSDKDRETRGEKPINPSSQPKRKSRASILLPFFDDLESPVASPSPGMKGSRSQTRRMTLSPATARSLMMEVIGDEGALPLPFECPSPLPLAFSVYSEAVDIIPPRTGREAAEGPCTGPFNRSIPTQDQICRLNTPGKKDIVTQVGSQQTAVASRESDSLCGSSHSSIQSAAGAVSVEQAAVRLQDDSSALPQRKNAVELEKEGVSPTAEVAVKTVPLIMMVEGDKTLEAISAQTNTTGSACVDLTVGLSLPLCTTATVRANSTYCEELDALLDSESDDNSSTTSSTLPYSPSLSTSLSSERSPSGSSSSPICLDHSCSPSSGSSSFSDFCTSNASTETPYMNQEYPKSPKKTGGRFPVEESLDFLFSSSGSEDCTEVVMDDSEEELGRLNNSIAVRIKSSKKGKKREYEDQSPRDTSVPWKCSPNQAILLEHSDRIIVPKDICGSPIVMEVDEDKGVGKAFLSIEEEQSEAKGMFKKSKVESAGEVTSFSPGSSPLKNSVELDKERERERDTVQSGSMAHTPHLDKGASSGSVSGTEGLCTGDAHAMACGSEGNHPALEERSRTGTTARTGPSSTNLKEAEMRAMSRLGIRQEVAKWKYHWEVASFCAAQTAREAQREE
jgi:hypothetical protein